MSWLIDRQPGQSKFFNMFWNIVLTPPVIFGTILMIPVWIVLFFWDKFYFRYAIICKMFGHDFGLLGNAEECNRCDEWNTELFPGKREHSSVTSRRIRQLIRKDKDASFLRYS